MKKMILASLLAVAATANASTADITLSKSIKPQLRKKIERDLELINSYKFKGEAEALTLKVMGLSSLNAETASQWLNKRVNYIISENALSPFNLIFKRAIYIDRRDVEFPNSNVIPYSLDKSMMKSTSDEEAISFNGLDEQKAFTVMSNIGSALYLAGKKQSAVYGMRISKGFLRGSEKVAVTSPRTGIIQIGEGLFAPELAMNKENPDALANSIFRLGTFFHESRHSDGNGASLGFMHTICPKGHDYEGLPACDENLNGPYTVGALMMLELSKACDNTSCSVADKQVLKMAILDSASRILPTTHKGEQSKNWDPSPESL